jgi:hypothetical protein
VDVLPWRCAASTCRAALNTALVALKDNDGKACLSEGVDVSQNGSPSHFQFLGKLGAGHPPSILEQEENPKQSGRAHG